jgi:uncharacterized membrane protein
MKRPRASVYTHCVDARALKVRTIRFLESGYFSIVGLLFGTCLFAVSLTPSLLPRNDVIQGVISGLGMAAGYAIGVFLVWLWAYLYLPSPRRRVRWLLKAVAAAFCLVLVVSFLWQAGRWQNSVRLLMGMEELAAFRVLVIGVVALLVFVLAWVVGKLFAMLYRFLVRKLARVVPDHVSNVVGLLLAFWLFWAVVDGVLVTFFLTSADRSYQQLDALIEPELPAPTEAMAAGGPESLLEWDTMGRQGRRFLGQVPEAADITAVTGQPALRPIRVYAGLNAAESPEERASLALEELIRVGGFERELLVLITPTGTGWVDPAAMEPVEFLMGGDIASVALQYSYLSSPLALISEGAYGVENAKALFRAVYGHWTGMPVDQRPRLFLFGLSLGAMNSDRSFDFYDIIDDPFDGALWSGPPFRADTWRSATSQRRPDSPEWLPRFRDDSVIRFANQDGGLERGEADWGGFRIAFLQYASDPITFFSPDSFFREPDWMRSPRGPDVSDDLRWFPIVTMLQLAADMGAGSSPRGYGHEYTVGDYLDAWHALIEPEGWDRAGLERLRDQLQQRLDSRGN